MNMALYRALMERRSILRDHEYDVCRPVSYKRSNYGRVGKTHARVTIPPGRAEADERHAPMRGILWGVLLSAPIWAILALAGFLLWKGLP